MNKKYLILLFLLIIPLAYSTDYDWLLSQASEDSWNNNIQDTSLAVLALKGSGETLDPYIPWLETKLESCMQTNTCNIKDASLSLMALEEFSSSKLEDIQSWLSDASIFQYIKYEEEKEGWKAQIISTVDGICTILDPQNPLNTITAQISKDYTPFVDITNLISTTTSKIKIDCTSLSTTPTALSLIRQSGTTFYINKEVTSQNQAILDLGYPCWGTVYQASLCDKESTAYALLALKNQDPKWLENQDPNALQNAILYKISNDNQYLTEVLDSQNQFGYWGSANVYDTAFIYSLIPDSDEKEKAAEWIQKQKAEDEICWPKPESQCKVRSTAIVLLSQAYTVTIEEETQEKIEQQKEIIQETQGQDCFDLGPGVYCITSDGYSGVCDEWGQCKRETEAGARDCYELGEGVYCITSDGIDGVCDAFGDCVPTETAGEVDTREAEKKAKEEKSSVLFWFLMVLLLLIILGGGGYYAYKRGWIKLKGTKKKPTQPTLTTPFRHPLTPASQIRTTPTTRPARHPIKRRVEGELDKSIRDMERLLRGRKKK